MITKMFKIIQLKGARLKGSTQTQLIIYQRSSLATIHNLAKHVKNRINITET